MESFLKKTVSKSLQQIPSQYLDFIITQANSSSSFFSRSTGNYFPVPESVTKGLEFICNHFPVSTSDLITMLTFSNRKSKDSSTYYKSLYHILYSLHLLTSIGETLYLKTFLGSMKSVIQFYITHLNPILINFEQAIHLQHKTMNNSNNSTQDFYKNQDELNTVVCLAWVLVKEGLTSEALGRKIVEIVLVQQKYKNMKRRSTTTPDEEDESVDSSLSVVLAKDSFSSSTTSITTSSTTSTTMSSDSSAADGDCDCKSWQEYESASDPLTNANILRLAYTVGIGKDVEEEGREEDEYEQLQAIESHLLCILRNKSYLQMKSSSTDAFLYSISQLVTICKRAKELFEQVLLECVQERLLSLVENGQDEDDCNHQSNTSDNPLLDFSMKIITFDSLQLLQHAKIRNKLCNEFNALKEAQNCDGSWLWRNSAGTTNSSTSIGETVSDGQGCVGAGNNNNRVVRDKQRGWRNEKLITTIFALKAIHVFYERRSRNLIGNVKGTKFQHTII